MQCMKKLQRIVKGGAKGHVHAGWGEVTVDRLRLRGF